MMSHHAYGALQINTEFGLDHGADLEVRFAAGLSR